MNLNERMNLRRLRPLNIWKSFRQVSVVRAQGWRQPWAPAAFGRIWRGVLVTGAAIWFLARPGDGIASTDKNTHQVLLWHHTRKKCPPTLSGWMQRFMSLANNLLWSKIYFRDLPVDPFNIYFREPKI